MNTKLYIFIAWLSYFALLKTSDEFWRFCLIYSCAMATFAFFYRLENRSPPKKKK